MESGHPAGRQSPGRSVWAVIGTVLAVLLAIGGLAIVGAIVLIYITLSYQGGNK